MARRRGILPVFIMTAVALSGCTDEPGVDEAEIPVLSLFARELPSHIQLGDSITFKLVIKGDTATSSHVGGHYWADATSDPTGDFALQAGACQHVAGSADLPGTFTVICTPMEQGWHYVRGHVRLTIGGEELNYWSDEHVVLVRAAS